MLDLEMSPEEALKQPRIHHQWFPDRLMFEPSLTQDLHKQLLQRGHILKTAPSMGVSQIVARNPNGEGFVGAADPERAVPRKAGDSQPPITAAE